MLRHLLEVGGALRAGLPLVLRVSVTPVVYLMAMISFVGWFFFVLFGGIGLSALPMDLISAYRARPSALTKQAAAQQKEMMHVAGARWPGAGRSRQRTKTRLFAGLRNRPGQKLRK